MAKCKYVATVEVDIQWDDKDPGMKSRVAVRDIIMSGQFESEIKELLESELSDVPCDVNVTRQFADIY